MSAAGIAGALMAVSLVVGVSAAAQDANPVQPPNIEQERRKLGPAFEHLEHQQPYRDLGQYPALRGEAPSAAPPRETPPPVVRCTPQPSVRPSYDRPSNAASPPSCGPS
jgi:hypothetical protein